MRHQLRDASEDAPSGTQTASGNATRARGWRAMSPGTYSGYHGAPATHEVRGTIGMLSLVDTHEDIWKRRLSWMLVWDIQQWFRTQSEFPRLSWPVRSLLLA